MSLKSFDQLNQFKSDIFFESGTYLGETAKYAKSIFDRVITVELQAYLYEKAKSGDESSVEFYLGDSPHLIVELLKDVSDKKITFWLDAHIDPGNYIQGITPNVRKCPLMEELESIKKLSRNDHTILIDDVRAFGTIGWGDSIYIDDIRNKILEINPKYKIGFIDGGVPNDILFAIV